MLTRLLRDVEATLVNHQSLKAHFDYAVERNGDLNPDLRTAHESELKTFLIALLSSKEVKVIGGSRSYIGQLVLSVMQQNETNEVRSSPPSVYM
ncbi:unnamed protein product [Soboliphyme baturini]|uniref:GCP_N_terminal domain-containing protein n=1 Tax=Soboliphyme baturini TaxID=241478 RepID=A0A183JB08_9BILA|nr:unnamed protein product [Soboliphyme baturini]